MIADDSVHWVLWNTSVLNNVWNWHMPVGPYRSINCGNRGISRHNMPASSSLINNAVFATSKLHRPNVYCWSSKQLSPYTGCISEWISFALSPFAQKKQVTARCSLRDDFNSNVAIFNVHKWRDKNVFIIKLTAGTQELNSLQNVYFQFFNIRKTNRMMLFCNLFIERPSYIYTLHICAWDNAALYEYRN